MSPEERPGQKPVLYRGEPLEADRGPGLGCFWLQIVALVTLIVLTPLSVAWGWPSWLSAVLLFAVIALLFVAGQTVVFLLRLVAADRRADRAGGRRRPLASATPTVGEIEDAGAAEPDAGAAEPDAGAAEPDAGAAEPDAGPETNAGTDPDARSGADGVRE